MKSKINVKTLLICIAIPLAVGLLASLLTRNGIESSKLTQKPPLSPPDWLFPIVWTILYTLMGIASYLVIQANNSIHDATSALQPYGIQLALNFLWTIVFFNLKWYFVAFLVIIALWIFIYLTIQAFYKESKYAAYAMIPYLIWVTFAAYLNLGIWLLN